MLTHGWAETRKESKAEVKEELNTLGLQNYPSSQGRGLSGTSYLSRHSDCQKRARYPNTRFFRLLVWVVTGHTYAVFYVMLAKDQ